MESKESKLKFITVDNETDKIHIVIDKINYIQEAGSGCIIVLQNAAEIPVNDNFKGIMAKIRAAEKSIF